MKKSILFVASCALATAAGSGCGPIKDMGDMKNTTDHMAGTTDGMAQTTGKMAGDVHTTACEAYETYTNLRQGNTLQARVGEDQLAEMNTAHAIEDKIFHAGAYMKAFEFQIWNCPDPNSSQYLKAFYMQAAEEFTRVLPNYLTTDKSKWNVSPTNTDNSSNNLYAIAVSLQELNADIVTAYKTGNWDEQPQSLLDLIEYSLTNKDYLAAHPDKATLADHEFLANEDLLVQLLQVRMNFLSAMALAKVSDIEKKGTWGIPGLLREAGMWLRSWEPNIRKYGDAQDVERIKEFTRYLYGSNDIAAYLLSIGVKPNYDGTIHKMYSHMSTRDALRAKIKNPTSDADLAFNNTQDQIQNYLTELKIYLSQKATGFVKIPQLDHPELYSY